MEELHLEMLEKKKVTKISDVHEASSDMES